MAVKHTSEMYKDHRSRMRDRFMANPDALEDTKLLEMYLFECLPRVDTFPVAHGLIRRFGSLDGVFSASIGELASVDGVGRQTAFRIHLIGKIFERIADGALSSSPLNTYEAVSAYLTWIFRNCRVDDYALLYLKAGGELIEHVMYSESTRGKISLADEIKRKVIENGASCVVMAHKHPSNHPEPSGDDLESTKEFYEICRGAGVVAEEHFIVSGSSVMPVIARVTGSKTKLFEKMI